MAWAAAVLASDGLGGEHIWHASTTIHPSPFRRPSAASLTASQGTAVAAWMPLTPPRGRTRRRARSCGCVRGLQAATAVPCDAVNEAADGRRTGDGWMGVLSCHRCSPPRPHEARTAAAHAMLMYLVQRSSDGS